MQVIARIEFQIPLHRSQKSTRTAGHLCGTRAPTGRRRFLRLGTRVAHRAQKGSPACDQKASLEPGKGPVSVFNAHPGSRPAVPGCCCFGCKSMSSRSQERLYLVTVYRYSTKMRMLGRQKCHVMQHKKGPQMALRHRNPLITCMNAHVMQHSQKVGKKWRKLAAKVVE